MPGLHVTNKRFVLEGLARACCVDASAFSGVLKALYSAGAVCRIAHPVGDVTGPQQIEAAWWAPLRRAFPDAERRDLVTVAGEDRESCWVGVTGFYQATFVHSFFDIPPTGGVVHLRYGEMHKVCNSQICQSWILVDFADLMHQAGCWPLNPSLGTEGLWPGPAVAPSADVDPVGGAESLLIVRAMHHALLSFDGQHLESMDHERYWTPNFMWYGPSGIGTTRGLKGFQHHHQIPFLRALPDRSGGDNVYLGDGNFVCNAAWPGMTATHTGGDWLGLPPTGRKFSMRVMDFYRLENGLIAENWVPIDILDILQQLGVDAFGRMRHLTGRPREHL